MSTSPAEALQDAAEFREGHEIELACGDCAETWIVVVREGEDVTQDQAECPVTGCPGEGEEV